MSLALSAGDERDSDQSAAPTFMQRCTLCLKIGGLAVVGCAMVGLFVANMLKPMSIRSVKLSEDQHCNDLVQELSNWIIFQFLPCVILAACVGLVGFLLKNEIIEMVQEKLGLDAAGLNAWRMMFTMYLLAQDVVLDGILGVSYLNSGYKVWGTIALLIPEIAAVLGWLYRRFTWIPTATHPTFGFSVDEEGNSRPGLWELLLATFFVYPLLAAGETLHRGSETKDWQFERMLEGFVEGGPSMALQTYVLILAGLSSHVIVQLASTISSAKAAAEATLLYEFVFMLGDKGRLPTLKDVALRAFDFFSRVTTIMYVGAALRPKDLPMTQTNQITIPVVMIVEFCVSAVLLFFVFNGRIKTPQLVAQAILGIAVIPWPLQPSSTPWERAAYQVAVILWRLVDTVIFMLIVYTGFGCELFERKLENGYLLAAILGNLVIIMVVCGNLVAGSLLPNAIPERVDLQLAKTLGTLESQLAARHCDCTEFLPLCEAPAFWSARSSDSALNEDELRKVIEYLGHVSAEMATPDYAGETPVCRAAKEGELVVLQVLLQHRANANLKSRDGSTPLLIAINCGNSEVVALLLKHGAEPSHVDDTPNTALHLAALRGHFPVVELLASNRKSIDAADGKKRTPLHLAAERGQLKVVELLLSRRASVELADKMLKTPFHLAIQNLHLKVADLLLSSRASIDAVDISPNAALHLAAEQGKVPAVEFLLERRASVDLGVRDLEGKTALHLAAKNRHLPVLTCLVSNRASIDKYSNEGKTALHEAAEHGHDPVVELLVSSRASIDAKAVEGKTALHLAAEKGHVPVVELLVSSRASIDAEAVGQQTALHEAAEKGHHQVVELLLKRRASIDAKDRMQSTALHSAARGGYVLVAKTLVNGRADINVKSLGEKTPLDLAEKAAGRPAAQVADYLKSVGARNGPS